LWKRKQTIFLQIAFEFIYNYRFKLFLEVDDKFWCFELIYIYILAIYTLKAALKMKFIDCGPLSLDQGTFLLIE